MPAAKTADTKDQRRFRDAGGQQGI